MKSALRLLLTLFMIVCSTTISGASIQETQAGVVFEESGVSGVERSFFANFNAPKTTVHKNSLDYVGDTHVYRVKGPDGSTYKIGESANGVRVRDGASKRAEQQARKLLRETGDTYTTQIRKTFPDKRSAREYETRVIERFRRMFGQDKLPGNKTNR